MSQLFKKYSTINGDAMDLYQELGKAVQDNISGKWEKATVKIESSLNKMCSFQAEYTLSSFEKKN